MMLLHLHVNLNVDDVNDDDDDDDEREKIHSNLPYLDLRNLCGCPLIEEG